MELPLNPEQLLLDAVNILLETINELPIETEEDFENIMEARQARNKLIEVKRAVLSEGWDFNTDDAWVFSPSTTGIIPISPNILDLTASRNDVVVRDGKFYSKSDMSFQFEDDVTAKVIWDMDFNSLTHPLRHYITIRAARVFGVREIGATDTVKYNAEDEKIALIAARRSETRTGGYNMLGGTYGQNNRVRS